MHWSYEFMFFPSIHKGSKLNYEFLLLMFVFTSGISAQPAFPGAEGGGAVSVGGRGGDVIEVTNLNNSGAGSFRAACEAERVRTVVFRIGGTIEVKDDPIVIQSPYITIAGQTAPGDGITIRSGEKMTQSPIILKNCHDVIIRYLRVRPGPYANDQAGDAITVYKSAYNVIIDHCSMTWSLDENTEVWSDGAPAHNFTWQWCIIAEGLGSHSCGFNSGSGVSGNPGQMHDITIHHNLFAHNAKRNPLFKVKTGEIINNIVYGWKYYPTQVSGGVVLDIIGNKYVQQDGIVSGSRREIMWHPYDSLNNNPQTGPTGNPSIYLKGNIGPRNNDPEADAWNLIMERTAIDSWGWPDDDGDGKPHRESVPISYKRSTPREMDDQVTINSVKELDAILLGDNGVGASMQLTDSGKLVPARGVVDKRIIDEYKDNAGKIPNSPDDVGGYPVVNTGTLYTDDDHDGMADKWEVLNGLNPADPEDRNGTNLSAEGYTNLEMFLNGRGVFTVINLPGSSNADLSVCVCPNPFYEQSEIKLFLPSSGMTRLMIYDNLGNKVATIVDRYLAKGNYNFKFTPGYFLEGTYIYKLHWNNCIKSGKIILLKRNF